MRVFDVEGEGNGRLVKMALGDARRVLASLTVTHVRPLGESLNAVRGARSLCDVVLHAAGRDFPAHKVSAVWVWGSSGVLAHFGYFWNLFSHLHYCV